MKEWITQVLLYGKWCASIEDLTKCLVLLVVVRLWYLGLYQDQGKAPVRNNQAKMVSMVMLHRKAPTKAETPWMTECQPQDLEFAPFLCILYFSEGLHWAKIRHCRCQSDYKCNSDKEQHLSSWNPLPRLTFLTSSINLGPKVGKSYSSRVNYMQRQHWASRVLDIISPKQVLTILFKTFEQSLLSRSVSWAAWDLHRRGSLSWRKYSRETFDASNDWPNSMHSTHTYFFVAASLVLRWH